jgi:hypothetical protein
MKHFIIYVLLCCFSIHFSFAQQDTAKKEPKRPVNTGYITLGAGIGISSFWGDLNFGQNFNGLSSFRLNYTAHVEKRIGKVLGVSLHGNMGKVAQNERSLSRNLNFETRFTQFGGALSAHFDWYESTKAAPFFSVGLNYMKFDVYSDLRDEKNNAYHYWSDGKIRSSPQKDSIGNIITYLTTPSELQRDYSYETRLNETFDPQKIQNSETSCLVIPITVGLKFRLAEFVDARLSGTYSIVNSDYMDNYWNGINDAFTSVNFSVHYTLGKKYISPEELVHKDVNFGSIAKEDTDFDQVPDMLDDCPHTPKGIEVDSRGCPIDKDGDGVADYLDKEPATPSGAVVNRDGITLSEQELKKLYELRESTYMEKINKFYELPTEETLRKIADELNKDIVVDDSSYTTEAVITQPEEESKPEPTIRQNADGTIEQIVVSSGAEVSEKTPIINNSENKNSETKPKSDEEKNNSETKSVPVTKEVPKTEINTSSSEDSKTTVKQSPENIDVVVKTEEAKEEKALVLPMPQRVRFADKNGDGMLQSKEITTAIDEYLEGEIDVTVTDIMDMIDYFFSQQ